MNNSTLSDFTYFKCAPITSVDKEQSFSKNKHFVFLFFFVDNILCTLKTFQKQWLFSVIHIDVSETKDVLHELIK